MHARVWNTFGRCSRVEENISLKSCPGGSGIQNLLALAVQTHRIPEGIPAGTELVEVVPKMWAVPMALPSPGSDHSLDF